MKKRRGYFFVKRCFDFFAALLGIIVTSPIWLITVIGIFVSDPGPIFYRAIRIGKDNCEFSMWKFRSMRVPRKESEKSEASFKADTNRIFPFGGLIRRLKIDELPQLLNILGGSMSVVGPRPAAKDQVEVMRAGKYGIASTVKPGLTGPAALYDYIYGDSVEELEEYEKLVLPTRLELEAYYPTHMGIGYDIKMIWYTVVCILASIFKREPKKIFKELTSAVEPAREENVKQEETFSEKI
ncbi:MAG: sugar transferase [Ruminococcaceae bacterium]|nr:sugar transferase [Oscillospiraceae bacterium]